MLLIETFMLDPAKLATNWVRASGRSRRRREAGELWVLTAATFGCFAAAPLPGEAGIVASRHRRGADRSQHRVAGVCAPHPNEMTRCRDARTPACRGSPPRRKRGGASLGPGDACRLEAVSSLTTAELRCPMRL